MNPPPPLPEQRSPLLKLELKAYARKDLSDAKAYLEKFATHNFPRNQIHYPRCSGCVFREINAEKVIFISQIVQVFIF